MAEFPLDSQYREFLAALAELPPTKVERFAIALGVPNRVIEESGLNHPGSIYRVKSDALKWWIRNADDRTWEAIAKALESTEVEERNLAKKIRTKQGIDQGSYLHTSLDCSLPLT